MNPDEPPQSPWEHTPDPVPAEDASHDDEEAAVQAVQQQRRRRKKIVAWSIGGVVVLLVAAYLLFVLLWSTNSSTSAAPLPPPAPSSTTAHPQPTKPSTKKSTPRPKPTVPPNVLGQAPGTVRLPQGGTANLVRSEVSADGELPVPTDLNEATWWGAGLGAPNGAALLTGHVNWQGRNGPFGELASDRAGQNVTVLDASNHKWTYRLTKVLTVHKDQLASVSQQYFSQRGPHRLVLVTCGGRFVGGDEGYDENVIGVADLVSRPEA